MNCKLINTYVTFWRKKERPPKKYLEVLPDMGGKEERMINIVKNLTQLFRDVIGLVI